MISSMTGFARRETRGSFGVLACELRSVNHRYLEPGFRLPEELRSVEGELRQRLGRDFKRGKIDCSVHLRLAQGAAATELAVDEAALQRLLARVRQVGATLPDGHTVDVMEVLRWPGIVREEELDREGLLAVCREVFAATCAELAAARAREGARLRELIEQRCETLAQLVSQVRARLPEVRARLRASMEEKLAEIRAEVAPERMEQEVALLLTRFDVDEELDRLVAHVDETRRIVSQDGESAGRRLDFLMQELNREANTLSSKSQDIETTRLAVDMKVVIEQIREQVQNVE